MSLFESHLCSSCFFRKKKELYEILKKCDSVYNVRLYEPEHVNVLLGLVPPTTERYH